MTVLPTLYSLAFDDEFSSFASSQTGTIGWTTELPFWNSEHTLHNEAEYYVDSSQPNTPFRISNGVLTIEASQASNTGTNPLSLPYNSGVITTYKSFSQLYGYFEVRAQLPSGAGLWPAFWLMPTSFKAGPELDVFEVLGDQPNILYSTVHSADPQQALLQRLNVADTSAAFHTYGVDWGPKTTLFYMDGQAIASVATPADMNVPMYMLLNLAVGGAGSWPGPPTGQTQFPADMNIDFVHAYKTVNTIGWTDPTPSQPSPLLLPSLQAAAVLGSSLAYVFVEHYGNQDAGTPLGGIGVALRNASGQIVATGITASNGYYTFSNLGAGDYSVQYITPSTYSIRAGNFADATTGVTGNFSLSAGQSYGVPYQLVTSSAELAGTVQLDSGSAPGLIVALLNVSNETISTTQTDTAGRFNFWVPAGQYTVKYNAPAGTRFMAGPLADTNTGLSAPIVLADGQDFLLIPEQLITVSTVSSPVVLPELTTNPVLAPQIVESPIVAPQIVSSPAVMPSVLASPFDNVSVYRFFDKTNGTQFLTASATERDSIINTRTDLIFEGVGISAVDASGDANGVPVYRFFDTHAGTHFYTSSSSERDNIIGIRPDLTFEGISFYEHQAAELGDTAVYRFFDTNNGTHFYTSSASERSEILATRSDLTAEGVAFYAPIQS